MSVYRFAGSAAHELEDDLVMLDYLDDNIMHDNVEQRTTVQVINVYNFCY